MTLTESFANQCERTQEAVSSFNAHPTFEGARLVLKRFELEQSLGYNIGTHEFFTNDCMPDMTAGARRVFGRYAKKLGIHYWTL